MLAVLLLTAPLLRAAGAARAADVVLVLATAVVAPLALLRVVPHGRDTAAMRGLEAAIGVSGAVAVAATAAGAQVVGWSAGLTSGVLVFCAGWLLFEQSAGDERRQVLWLVLGVVHRGVRGVDLRLRRGVRPDQRDRDRRRGGPRLAAAPAHRWRSRCWRRGRSTSGG